MILLAALLATHVCSADGQPFAELRPASHEIELGVCGSSERPVVRRVELIVDRPRDPMKIEVAVDKRWGFTATAKDLAEIQTIRAPATATRLTLRAPHYRDAAADLTKTPAKIVLRRMPVIRGRVLSPSGQPLANPSVQPASCIAASDGVFTCEISDEWPRSIVIASPKYATKIVTIDKGERDLDLGDLQLGRGAVLTLRVDAPGGIRAATAMLYRDDIELAERKLQLPLSEPVAFTNLETGTLQLLIKGSRPLQQRVEKITIDEGDNSRRVSIEESELTVKVYAGSRPEQGATVVLKNYDGKWSGTVETDESGSAVEPLWQLGAFTAAVRAKNSTSPVFDHHEFTGGEKQQWTLHLPIGRIEGVVKAEDGSAVADAEVSLTTDDGEMTSALHVKSDAAGHYGFDGVHAGAQSVGATADGYLPSDAVEFRLVENEEARRADLTLHRGKRASVDVIDHRGVPIARAAVIATLDGAALARSVSDENGRAEIQLPASGSPVLFVIPAGGSFAVHRVTSIDRDSSVVRINVGEPSASLELKTETTDHRPVRDVNFLVRYDGESVPIDVLMQLPPFRTGPDGTVTIAKLPLGLYELWPFARTTTAQDTTPAPLRIALTPGVNSATLTFRPAHR